MSSAEPAPEAGLADPAVPADPPAEAPAEPGTDTAPAADGGADPVSVTVEDLIADLDRVSGERDSHLEDLQRITAEFANFRKQSAKRQTELIEQAAAGLAAKLLPVLDACEAAVGQGATDVVPVHAALVDVLAKEGMAKISATGVVFDPEQHEAVMHEPGEGDGESVVVEILRAGYSWNGRVLQPAMVKVRG